jgi:hypothetical protein
MALTMLAMRRWFQFEQQVKDGRLLRLPLNGLMQEHEGHLVFGIRQCVRQFTDPISLPEYAAIRRLFFERMEVCHVVWSAHALRPPCSLLYLLFFLL